MKKRISDAVVRRLARYYGQLQMLEKAGVERVSSARLSEEMGLTASQIRQDLNCFGGFGQQGYGYGVRQLKEALEAILGLERRYRMVITGVGNIGQALLRYGGFKREGFDIIALFDIDPNLIGREIDGVRVYPVDRTESFVKDNKVDIGVITTPVSEVQAAADRYQRAGIRAIWNFAPAEIWTEPQVCVEHVRLSNSLFTLVYRLNESVSPTS